MYDVVLCFCVIDGCVDYECWVLCGVECVVELCECVGIGLYDVVDVVLW